MQPEEKEMLKKTLELAQENNKMLYSIRRGMMWGRVMRVIYWDFRNQRLLSLRNADEARDIRY